MSYATLIRQIETGTWIGNVMCDYCDLRLWPGCCVNGVHAIHDGTRMVHAEWARCQTKH